MIFLNQIVLDQIRKLLLQYIDAATTVRYKCAETIAIEVLNSVMTLSKLFDLLAVRENGVHPGEGEHFIPTIQSWFLFCLIWSVGASVDEPGRNVFDLWLRDQDPRSRQSTREIDVIENMRFNIILYM
jgi:dynein heavy chain